MVKSDSQAEGFGRAVKDIPMYGAGHRFELPKMLIAVTNKLL